MPLENAYFKGFYDEMIDFIWPLMETALKTNNFLQFAVITSCLRISKENNPWSIINYVKGMVYRNTEFPKPYWSNTSSNSIVQELVTKEDIDTV